MPKSKKCGRRSETTTPFLPSCPDLFPGIHVFAK
jgi:hypothetical protein